MNKKHRSFSSLSDMQLNQSFFETEDLSENPGVFYKNSSSDETTSEGYDLLEQQFKNLETRNES
jgi:hypothetical protein